MGKIIDRTITKIVADEGIALFRRVTKVLMPNGRYRYPVDYFDATPGVVKYCSAIFVVVSIAWLMARE